MAFVTMTLPNGRTMKFVNKRAAQKHFAKLAREVSRQTTGKDMNHKAKSVGPSFRVDKLGAPIAPSDSGPYRLSQPTERNKRFKRHSLS